MKNLTGDKVCDHTSVGMLVWKDGRLLLIEREKNPFGMAPPSGHVDGDPSFAVAARRELKEEVGLIAKNLILVAKGDIMNPCHRRDGNWHHWEIYNVEVEGVIHTDPYEVKRATWFTQQEIRQLARRTEAYIAKAVPEEEWLVRPGLEQVWYEWFKRLNII